MEEKSNKLKIGKYEIEKSQIFFLILHIGIIVAFVIQIIYSIYAFSIVANGGMAGARAAEIPIEELLRRRLYAIELWISVVGLTTYLAVVYRKRLSHFFDKVAEVKEEE